MSDKSYIKTYIKCNKFIWLGFFVPLLTMIFVFFVMQIAPFGGYSVLISDLRVSYVDQLTAFRRMLIEGESFFYTWSQIQGSTPFAFINLSPLNLLVILFPESAVQSAVTCIIILKIAFSGASFAYYLRQVFQRNDISISIFAWCYALMGYSIANHYQIIWLDQLILVPLILWGVERILEDNKKYLFFTTMLVCSFVTSFYLSYMTGLFAFLYFVYRYITKGNSYELKEILFKCIAFIKAPLLAFGCTAIYLLPILLMMKGRDGIFRMQDMSLRLRYEFTELFSKFFIGSFDTFQANGVPFIYCGIIVLILVGCYFCSYAISYKEKVASFALLAFMFSSLTINPLYVAWHGFKPPVYFEGRFSYLVSFMMILLAYKAYHHIQTISSKQMHMVFGILVGTVILFNRSSYGYIKDNSLLFTLAFIAIYYSILMLGKKGNYDKKQVVLLLGLVVGLELTTNAMLVVKRLDEVTKYPIASDYIDTYQQIDRVTSSILREDQDMYRIEFVDKRGLNDGFGVGFPSISHFDSIYNFNVKEAIDRLGVTTGHNWIQYKGTTPIVDTLLNIKYIACEEETYFGYEYVRSEDYSRIFLNPYTISLGFMIPNDLNALPNEVNPIKFQQILLNTMVGETAASYFTPIISNHFTKTNIGLVEKEVKQGENDKSELVKHYYEQDENQDAELIYELSIKEEGSCYLYMDSDNCYYVDVIVNDISLGLSKLDMGSVHYLGDFTVGDKVQVTLRLKEKYFNVKEIYFYQFKQEAFKKAVEQLRKHELVVTKHTDTEIEGTIQVEDDKSILYLSIPYDEGWRIQVDGQSYDTLAVYNGFLGVQLNSGEHQIKLKYTPKGFKVGGIVTLSTIFIVFLVKMMNRKVNNKVE